MWTPCVPTDNTDLIYSLTKGLARKAGFASFIFWNGGKAWKAGNGGKGETYGKCGKCGKSFNALWAPHTAPWATFALKFSRAEGWGLPAFGGSVACDGFFVRARVPGLVIGLAVIGGFVVGVIGVLGEL